MATTSPANPQPVRVGEWILDPRVNELRREGRIVRLEPKAVEVLAYLSGRPGAVVSRDELLTAVWPGVIVGDDALTQAIIKLRKALEDDAHTPRYIETISKRGYRLIAPVSRPSAAEAPASATLARRPRGRARVGAALGVTLLLAAAGWILASRDHPWPWPFSTDARGVAAAPRPTVAVLPLANLTGDASRDYFTDGMTEDIIGALGRFSGIRVMSRAAVQPYKGKTFTPRELREQLGARYIVQGSVREAGGRIRAAVELSDAEKGSVLWSDRYDGAGKELFEIQDRIVRSVVGALAVKVSRIEYQRASARPVESLEAHDLVLRAREMLYQGDREKNRQARALLARALELAPDYAEAYATLSYAEFVRGDMGWVEDTQLSMTRSIDYARRALAIDDPGANSRAHAQLTRNYSMLGRFDEALAEGNRAIAINPSDSVALYARGALLIWMGRPEEGVADIESARSFGGTGTYLFDLANAAYMTGRYREAVTHADAGLARSPDSIALHTVRAAALGQLGDPGAGAAAAHVRRLSPFFRVELTGNRFKNPQDRDRYQEGLRKAGL